MVVEPGYPLEGGVFDGFQGPPRPSAVDDFGFEQPDHRLGEGVVVGSTDAPNERLDPVRRIRRTKQSFRVPNADILGGFTWSSQHRDGGCGRWRSGGGRIGARGPS